VRRHFRGHRGRGRPAARQGRTGEFLETLGLEEAGLDRLIRAGYDLLGLITYFTAGPKETRAWTITEGTKAPGAAGVIHTDFERGFIRAQTIAYDDYVALGGETAAKEAGKARDEGKEYVVQDGDVLLVQVQHLSAQEHVDPGQKKLIHQPVLAHQDTDGNPDHDSEEYAGGKSIGGLRKRLQKRRGPDHCEKGGNHLGQRRHKESQVRPADKLPDKRPQDQGGHARQTIAKYGHDAPYST
jgi:hypothetical protein